jgi:hypothetical protein
MFDHTGYANPPKVKLLKQYFNENRRLGLFCAFGG